MFEDMMARIDNETVRYLFHIQVQKNEQPPQGGNAPDGQQAGQQAPIALQARPQPPAPQQMRAPGPNVSSSGLPAPAQRIGAAAAARSDAAPATPQHLPAFAKEMDRRQQRAQQDLRYQTGQGQAEAPKPVKAGAKVGRNDLCPCGSGKKYKKCHGANA